MNYYYNFVDDVKTAKFKLLTLYVFGIIGILLALFFVVQYDSALYLILIPFFAYEIPAIAAGWWRMGGVSIDWLPDFLVLIFSLILKLSLVYIVGFFVLPSEYKKLKKMTGKVNFIEWIKELFSERKINYTAEAAGEEYNGRYKKEQ